MKKRRSNGLKITASILLLVATGYLLNHYSKTTTITYAYSADLQAIQLPDSSLVYLEPGATLTVHRKFKRAASLEGNAFFDIHSDPKQAFSLEVAQTKIQVLGTSFDVNTQNGVTVKLYEGQIQFMTSTDTLKLRAGEQVHYQDRSSFISQQQLSDSIPPLVLRNATLEQLCQQLEKRYRYKITLVHPINDFRVTGQFSSQDDIKVVLDILKQSVPIEYTIKNRHITITTSSEEEAVETFRIE